MSAGLIVFTIWIVTIAMALGLNIMCIAWLAWMIWEDWLG